MPKARCQWGSPEIWCLMCCMNIKGGPKSLQNLLRSPVSVVERNLNFIEIGRLRIEHKLFFLKIFGHPRDIPAKPRDIPPKKVLISLVSRNVSNFLAPTPSRGRPLSHRKNITTPKFGFVLFFFRAWGESESVIEGFSAKFVQICVCNGKFSFL